MTTEMLAAQVKGLELQLAVLKARLQAVGEPAPGASFGTLEGMLAGIAESTEDDIEAAEYRADWDDEGAGK